MNKNKHNDKKFKDFTMNTEPIETMTNIDIEVFDDKKLKEKQNTVEDNKKKYYEIDRYFPPTSNVDSSKLQITSITPMMSTESKNAESLSDNIIKRYNLFIKDQNKIKPVITDATASIGCDTIAMALSDKFSAVNSVELLKPVFDVLSNNVRVYNIKNIKLYNNSYDTIYKDIKQDIVYIDAPWYKDFNLYKRYNLFLGKTNIVKIAEELLNMKLAKMIVLKVPPNFHTEYPIRVKSIQHIIIDKINNDNNNHSYSLIYLF